MMKRHTLALLGLLNFLFAVPVVSGEGGEGSLGGDTAGGIGGAAALGDHVAAEPGPVPGEAAEAAPAGVAGGSRPASSATAAGYILDEVKEGNIKIEGATDTEVPDR